MRTMETGVPLVLAKNICTSAYFYLSSCSHPETILIAQKPELIDLG